MSGYFLWYLERAVLSLVWPAHREEEGTTDRQAPHSDSAVTIPRIDARIHSASLTLRSTSLSEDHSSGGSQDATFTGLRGTALRSHYISIR